VSILSAHTQRKRAVRIFLHQNSHLLHGTTKESARVRATRTNDDTAFDFVNRDCRSSFHTTTARDALDQMLSEILQ
jgi:hypothetical protein